MDTIVSPGAINFGECVFAEMEKSGLETQLQEYMQFLQHLSKDARDKSTAEWVCKGLTYSRKKPPLRPGTAPGRICTQVRANHAEFAERSSCAIPESLKPGAGNFDDPRYVEPASREQHLWEVGSEASTMHSLAFQMMPPRIPSGEKAVALDYNKDWTSFFFNQ